MAVEDGATIGLLLGRLNHCFSTGQIPSSARRSSVAEVLALYELCQKQRTTTNVKGALNNRHFYHMQDGSEQQERDTMLASHTWTDERSQHLWCDMLYDRQLLDVDVLGNAEERFRQWLRDWEAVSEARL